MKNKLLLVGMVALNLGLVTVSTSINKEVVNAAEKSAAVEVKELLTEYYNGGSYKRNTTINLKNDEATQTDLIECFHAKCNILERETYFIGDELWMSRGTSDNYSYYGTEGSNMTSGTSNAPLVKPSVIKTAMYGQTMESYYTTMHDIKDNVAEDWVKNGNTYSTSNEVVIKQFLDFTAPCFLGLDEAHKNYWSMTSVEVEETNRGLELRLVTSGDQGKLTSAKGYLSEATINKVEDGKAVGNLLINYRLPNGELIDSYTQEVKEGETYVKESPSVRFMAPSIAKVEGIMDADGDVIDVIYDYSSESMVNVVNHGDDMGKLYVDATKGLSLSYVMKGSSGDWEQVFNGNTYAIYNGCIRVREAFPAMVYAGDWYDGHNAVNGAPWNALLSSDTEEILVTWSINPDGSVAVYKNGVKVFYFAANTHSNGQWTPDGVDPNLTVSNFTHNMLTEVATVGLKIGAFVDNGSNPVTWSMRDLSVGYAMNDATAASYASQYKSVRAIYVDDADNQIRNPYVSVSKIGTTYSIPTYEVPGYSTESSTVTGQVTADLAEVKVVYTRNGQERLEAPITRDRRNEGGWADPAWWVNIATLTEGSVVTAEYIVNSNNNNDAAWKCPIVVVYDTNNNANRCTHRFDWYGWEDGEFADAQNQGGMWCGSIEEYYAVAQDCTVRVTYQFIGGNLIETYIIKANSGPYAGKTYYWHPSVTGIHSNSITVALAPEYAQVILTSVYY